MSQIDLYALHLLRLVAEKRNFTAAAKAAGLSQSALSRQIQGIERQLGLQLLERTTRKVEITEAGAVFLRETEAIPNLLSGALRRIKEEFLDAPRQIRIGLSNELALSHVPGLFPKNAIESTKLRITQRSEVDLVHQVETNQLDLAIVTFQKNFPTPVEVTHEMTDDFCLIADSSFSQPPGPFSSWAMSQSWLYPTSKCSSRPLINRWMEEQQCFIKPYMELESFDLMIQFVALKMGVALVPRRALSAFPRKHQIQRLSLPSTLQRKLVVIRPRFSIVPEQVETFVKGILFS